MKKTVLIIFAFILLAPLQSKMFAQETSVTTGSIYKIISKVSGKALNVINSSVDYSINVDTWTDTGSDAERWMVTSVGDDQFTLTNVGSGKLLHIASTTPANSVKINQYLDTKNTAVRWKFVNRGDSSFVIQSAANTDYVVNLTNSATADGSPVTLYKGDNSLAQAWVLKLVTPQDAAPTAALADKIFTAWKAKYYDKNRTGNEVIAKEGFWGVAEMMEIVDDALEVSGNSKYSTLFNTMYYQFLSREGSDWMWNEFNDDITWMVIACTRASLITGKTTYQIKAKEQFDKMWARAYTTGYGGGLLWKQGLVTKNACINGPAMVACCYLAQATGDKTYYDKAITLYNWSKLYLFNPATGKVNDAYDGTVHDWSSTYNQGTYLGAAVMLYNYTKDPNYLLEAQRIAQFTKVTMFSSKVIDGETGPDLNGFKGIYMRYARRFVVDCNKADYIPWLQLNAKIAYNNRNTDNIIFTKWGTRTVETSKMTTANMLTAIPAFAASTAVSLLVNCPVKTDVTRIAYTKIEAEDFDYLRGIYVEACPEGTSNLANIRDGNYTAYNNVNFGFKGASSLEIRLSGMAEGNTIEIRLGSPTGKLIGTASIPNTGDWKTYATITCPITNVKGLQNVYLVYKGVDYVCKVNYFKFNEETGTSTGNGLLGEYFSGQNFTKSLLVRLDSTINFNWAEFSPASQVANDVFSARWTGKIEPRYTGTYTFYIKSDNGRKVWINDQLIIDKWINDFGTTYSGTIDLTAGQKYNIKVEYFESNSLADIKLEWQSDLQTREVIPASQLFLPDEVPSDLIDNKVNPTEGLTFYPNPVKSQLNIDFGTLEAKQVSIFNIQGKLLIQSNEKLSGSHTFDVSELSQGIYFVRIVTNQGEKRSLKFIK